MSLVLTPSGRAAIARFGIGRSVGETLMPQGCRSGAVRPRSIAILPRLCRLILALALLAPVRMVAAQAVRQQKRGMTADDLFRLQHLGTVKASPDGEWLAIVIARPWSSGEAERDFPFWEDRSDIWLLARNGGEARNLTNGASNRSGYWNPVWSPDGKRMAMLSTSGGDRVRPYVWEMVSGTIRRITDRAADLTAVADAGWPEYGMIWGDNTTLFCPVLPMNAPTISKAGMYVRAAQFWAKAERGLEPTASVLESGSAIPSSERQAGALLSIDVVSLRTTLAAEGNIRQLLVSPTRYHVAIIAETGRRPPDPTGKVPYGEDLRALWKTRFGMLDFRPDAKVTWINDLVDPRLDLSFVQRFPDPVPHSWSPDGSAIAVVAKSDPAESRASTAFVISASTGAVNQMTGRELLVSGTGWSTSGALLVRARERESGVVAEAQGRLDWWTVKDRHNDATRNLTGSLDLPPAEVMRTSNGDQVVGVASSALWSIDLPSGRTTNLTSGLDRVQAVKWPTKAARPLGVFGDLIIETAGGELYRLRVTDPKPCASVVPRPSSAANLLDLRADPRSAVFVASQSDGSFLWVGDSGSGRYDVRLRLNSLLAEIADPERRLITYRGTDGDTLRGVILLPVGYESGRRYPMITYVHAGLVVADTGQLVYFDKTYARSLNLNLLAAQGYAILIPSIPLALPGIAGDPMIDLPKGVMAAVDKAIDIGVADPERLGVMGQSYGGYSVYALITYTHRFRAAVALAGLSNLVSLYGTFYTPLRYDAQANEEVFQLALAESGQVRMGAPPWADLWRYLRNSPLYYMERVQTPVMIIHGDLDYVPIQQAEEFFTGLYRLGKKARFVRYWGEGHVITSPANVRHMWQETLAWFQAGLRTESIGVAATRGADESK